MNTLAWVSIFGALITLALVFVYFYFMRPRAQTHVQPTATGRIQ